MNKKRDPSDMARSRARKREAGYIHWCVWVKPEEKKKIEKFLKELRK